MEISPIHTDAVSFFPELADEARAQRQTWAEDLRDQAVEPIYTTLRNHISYVFEAASPAIEEQWGKWREAVRAIHEAKNMRIRFSPETDSFVLRAPVPDVAVSMGDFVSTQFFEIEAEDIQSDDIEILHDELLREVSLTAALSGAQKHSELWRHEILGGNRLGKDYWQHPVLGNSPITYLVDGEVRNADAAPKPLAAQQTTVESWARSVGAQMTWGELKKSTRFHAAEKDRCITPEALLLAAEQRCLAAGARSIDVSEISVYLRTYADLKNGSDQRSLVTKITRPDLMFDDDGYPTKETLTEYNILKSVKKTSKKLANRMQLAAVAQIAHGEDLTQEIVSAAIKRKLNPQEAVVNKLTGNIALLDLLTHSENYQKLTLERD